MRVSDFENCKKWVEEKGGEFVVEETQDFTKWAVVTVNLPKSKPIRLTFKDGKKMSGNLPMPENI